jgi:hypothetical protein
MSSPTSAFRSSTGARSGRRIPWSVSTRRSAGVATWSASFPTVARYSARGHPGDEPSDLKATLRCHDDPRQPIAGSIWRPMVPTLPGLTALVRPADADRVQERVSIEVLRDFPAAISRFKSTRPRYKPAFLLVLTATLFTSASLMSCGRAPTSSNDVLPTETPTATASSAASPSAAASPDETANWHSYTSPLWGYTVKYPAEWLSLDNFGAPNSDKYFSNENVGAPIELSQAGIWLTISVSGASGPQCLNRGFFSAPVDQTTPINIGGVPTTLYSVTEEDYRALAANVERSPYCYSFTYLFRSPEVRTTNEHLAQLMLGQTFQFGQPTAPPPPPP